MAWHSIAVRGRIDVFPTLTVLSGERSRGEITLKEKERVEREYLIQANLVLMPAEKWETCRNTGVR
jgi:hypothetical protein